MDRAAATSKIHKLEALAADSAATPGEAATARAMAQRLRTRYQILGRSAPPHTQARPPRAASRPASGVSVFGSRAAFVAAFCDAMADFDPNTGESKSARVHVERWVNRGNWKIEIDI